MKAMIVNNDTNVTFSVAFQVAFVLNVSAGLLDVAVVCGIVLQFSKGKRHFTCRPGLYLCRYVFQFVEK